MYQECLIGTLRGRGDAECFGNDTTVYVPREVEEVSDDNPCIAQYYSDREEFCTITYSYEMKKSLVELDYTVRCKPPVNKAAIGAVIIAVILGVGIILIVAYKFRIYRQDRAEWAKFEKSKMDEKWSKQQNPVYNSPITSYQVPLELRELK